MTYPRISLRCFFGLFFALAAALISHATTPPNTLPLELVNNSGIVSDSEVYIVIKTLNPATNNSAFVQVDPTTGVATAVDVNATTDASAFNYALSQLPLIGGKRTMYLPYLASTRVYFSIKYPMDLHVTLNDKGVYTIPDPSPFDTRDSNYYTLYDKIELTFDQAAGAFSNPTAVDFFTLPLQLDQSGSTTGFTTSGFTHSRADIITGVQTEFNAVGNVTAATKPNWARLFVNYTDPTGHSALLRLISPSKAILPGDNRAPYFDNTYLNNAVKYGGGTFSYIDAVNTFYLTKTVQIDCSELTGVFALSNYILTGQTAGPDVNGNYNFNFDNGAGYTFSLQMPTDSLPFFAGAGETFDQANNTPPAIIVRQLTSAFDAGLLPAPDTTVLNHAYFNANKASYYTNNALLVGAGATQPWYDLYSKALHSFGDLVYTFAYDDALGQDGTLHDPSTTTPTPLIVTLGDMTGTVVPNPFSDPNVYTVNPLVGDGSVVLYKGRLLKTNETLTGVPSPFTCILNGETANIYLHDGFVRPYFDGSSAILVQSTGANAVNVVFPGSDGFPGRPTSSPIPTVTPTPTVKPPPTGLPTPKPTPIPTVTPTPVPTPTPTPSSPTVRWKRNPDGSYSGSVSLPNGQVKTFTDFDLPGLAIFAPDDVKAEIHQEADNIMNDL